MNDKFTYLRHARLVSATMGLVGACLCFSACERGSTAQDSNRQQGAHMPVAVATPKLKRQKLVKETYPTDPHATWTILASGVRWRDVVLGDGAELTSNSIGYFHIKTFLDDGTFHHSTMNERKPVCAAIGAGRLQREFEEALVGMRERGRRLVEFPRGLSYWSAGHLADGPSVPAGNSPRFDVTLLLVRPQKLLEPVALTGGTTSSLNDQRKEVKP
ncbi:MAG: FKBP-type peptidyl-prolyl cis-trans isomerase [Candidatus Sumerlaeaceae bacterium]|nr:FKBP-type peptidyl-prolyl cis-trans isomerase [Candidatus Sumerlaeaceae bacterium]